MIKYTGLVFRLFCTLIFLQFSNTSAAMELIDAKVPAALKKAYDNRYYDPQACITATEKYITQQKSFTNQLNDHTSTEKDLPLIYSLPIHLQAFCYTQIEDYSSALNLLQPLLKNPSISADEITTLNIIALDIPEQERPQLTNPFLLELLYNAAQKPLTKSPNLAVTLQLTITHLSLQINHYHAAYIALENAQKLLKENKNIKLEAWLNYYYGLYYDQINQPQLAISSFLSANKVADKNAFIQLSGQVKKGLADIYQKKHRFKIALEFTSQRVELYLATKNNIKQATSLIELGILKYKNNNNNQSLIYLFNALELIQNNKQSSLFARIYLELGRTYISNKENNHLQLAQKYLQNARLYFKHLNIPYYQIESLLLLAKLNIINHEPALAILQLEKVLQLSQDNYDPLRVQAFEMLASSYEITGDLQQAIVHFKNFQSLQNKIKERLFQLQQLQISEQLQLFENTQQQNHLEIQNTQLQATTDRYQIITYSSTSLLIIVTLLFLYMLKRNIKLNNAHQDAQRRLLIHPRTKLPFQHADSNHFQYMYHGTPLYYALLNIPFLTQLNELLGTYGAMKIEAQLGKELKMNFSCNVDIFQFRGNQILFIGKQQDYTHGGEFAQKIEAFFTSFCKTNKLNNNVSCGVVAFPFLSNASRTFSPSQTLNLSSLALFAASQIRKQEAQNSWVELYAIDNLQPAFFNGDLWQLGQLAIKKGIVKINTSHPGFPFYWSVSSQLPEAKANGLVR